MWLNRPKLTQSFPACLHPSSQWFKVVCEVEPPRTHSSVLCISGNCDVCGVRCASL